MSLNLKLGVCFFRHNTFNFFSFLNAVCVCIVLIYLRFIFLSYPSVSIYESVHPVKSKNYDTATLASSSTGKTSQSEHSHFPSGYIKSALLPPLALKIDFGL